MRLIVVLLLASLSTGCGLLYRQSVQQGNVLESEQVDALKPGMTKRQVVLVLGTPAIQSPFHDDRWEYVSSFKDADGKIELKRLTVVFADNVLTRIEGDYEVGKGVKAEGAEPDTPEAIIDSKSDS
jgi:outer membrane protein assembly factor BamE